MLLIFTDNDTIYWVDMGLSTISRAKRDQTWREDVVTNGIGRVEGIAVDWIAGERHLRHVKIIVCMTQIVEFKQYESLLLAVCKSVNPHSRVTYPNLYHIKDPKTDKN